MRCFMLLCSSIWRILATDLYLSVHARLLAAVEDHHGVAFRRVLDAFEVPHERIVLQLPPVRSNQDWPLAVVIQNYRNLGQPKILLQ